MKKLYKVVSILIIIILIAGIYVNKVKASNENVVLVLDAGHGGTDPGAQNLDLGLNEAELNIKIARYLKDYLNEYEGITVLMTHNGLKPSEYIPIVDRGMFVRNNKADMSISLHLNANASQLLEGAEIYVTANTSCKKYNEESTKLANSIINKITKLGIYNRGVKTRLSDEIEKEKYWYSDGTIADYYGMIRYPMKGDGEDLGIDIASGAGIPGIIVEHCFLKGNDAKYINSEEGLKKLAKADCEGIVEYYGLRKKGEAVKEITLDKTNINLIQGEKTKVVASVRPSTAKNQKLKWVSQDEKIAKVDKNGNIEAIGVGKTNIKVTSVDNPKIEKIISVNVDEIEVKLPEGEKIEIKNYKIEKNKISRIAEKTTIAEFTKNIHLTNNLEINIVGNKECIATNTIVEVKDKKTKKVLRKYYCIIYGEVNGDGVINSGDLLTIKKHLIGSKLIPNEVAEKSADINKDKVINSGDLLSLKRHFLGKTLINQNSY